MSVLTKAGIRGEVRPRVGDDDSNNYLVTDTTFNILIDDAYLELFKYARNEAENTSLTGDGTSVRFTVPSGLIPNLIRGVFLRYNSDPATDLPVGYWKVFGGKIVMPLVVGSGITIVVQYRKPYALADDVDATVAEMLYELLEISWIDYAAKKRSDFEQWAAIRRSDGSIGELLQIRRSLKTKLEEFSQEVSRNLEVTDVWSGI